MAPYMNQLIKRVNFNSSELIDLLASHDTLLKKITCDYLADKSSIDSNLSLLTANILLRDCNDANPTVRGASLLALSSLPGMEDAAVPSVAKAMADPAPQVRRIASMSCVNLHKHSSEVCLSSGLVDLLYDGIRDSDPLAIVNCLLALEVVLKEEGGPVINKNIAQHLLERLTQFSEGDIVYVLNMLMRYSPKKEEEIFDMLNELDFCLKSSSPSLLVTAIRYFFHLTKEYPHLTIDLFDVISNPVCKIMSQSRPELCYFIIEFLQSLSSEFKKNFCVHFKYFLVKSKDPAYLKEKKFEILPTLASRENLSEIVSEVKHYTSDYQSYKNAFQCMSALGSFDAEAEEEVLTILASVIKNSSDQVVEAALECLLVIIYKSEMASNETPVKDAPGYQKTLCSSVSLAISRAALQEQNPQLVLRVFQFFAPYLDNIQDFLEDFSKQVDSFDPSIRCLFLTCTCVAFLHWPAVVQPIIASVLNKALKSTEYELASHAAFVYAALEEGPEKAFKLLSVSNCFPLGMTEKSMT